jgi:hypothetical protein
MDVVFIFLDDQGIEFKVNMETVPRVGEGIILSHLKREDFRSQEDYNRFKNNGYEHREWVIEEISWFPQTEGSYVGILLVEVEAGS